VSYVLVVSVVGLLLTVNVLLVRPAWWIGMVVLAVAATVPAQVPTAILLGGFGIQFSEIALTGAAIYTLFKFPPNTLTDRCAFAVFLLTLAFAGYGLSQYPANHVAGDARGMFALALALIVAGRIAGTPTAVVAMKAVRLTLWGSLLVVTLGAVGSIQIAARATDATLDGSGTVALVTRVQSPTTHLAAVVLAICIALWVTQRGMLREILWYAVPALGLTIFAYSRNALVLVAIAAVVTPLLERKFRGWVRMILAAGVGAFMFVAAGWVLSQVSDLTAFGYLNRMYTAYSDRVLVGLSAEAQSVDRSVLYREIEIVRLRAAIPGFEFFGHGLGFSYQPQRDRATPNSAFYAHHYYYWLMVKTGAVGVVAYLVAFVAPLIRAARWPGNPFRSACAATAAGLFYISTVAPMPISTNGGPLFGALLGIAAGLWSARPDAPSRTVSDSQSNLDHSRANAV
jgi:O-antigen ligase